MADIVRPVGYVGGLQRLTWTLSAVQVQAYLWGGGGGGGGRDRGRATNPGDSGGNGTGGGYSEISFVLNTGDTLEVAVGQGGAAGQGGAPGVISAAGGLAGQSLIYNIFDSRNASGAVAVTDPRWSPFMNSNAVWSASGGETYNYSETINFPYTGYYTFTYAVDDQVTIRLDGSTIINFAGFTDIPPVTSGILVSAGNHTLSWTAENTGGDVRGIALTVTASLSGGNGSSAGPEGFSGGGGAGGGATALFKNNEIVAIAAGGGGGGGGGRNLSTSANAPGPNGVTLDGVFAGQTGQSKSGDGGGAGGGGGGYAGGQGGSVQDGDSNGTGGSFGRGLGSATQNPISIVPGGRNNEYYNGGSFGGLGGSSVRPQATEGATGYAVFVFQIPGIFVRQNNAWLPARSVYVRNNDAWQQAQEVYVRQDNSWFGVQGSTAPQFVTVASNWGRLPRPNI